MNTPETDNPLEHALSVAARGSQGYPELFRQLLKSHLLILIPHAPAMDDLRPGERLTVSLWKCGDEEVVPVFTSVERAAEGVAAIGDVEGARWLAGFDGATLFQILRRSNVWVVINAGCGTGELRLGPTMIAKLADGSILRPSVESLSISGPAQVVQAVDYPIALVDPVFRFLCGCPAVQAAWLLRMMPAAGENAGIYIFAILAIDATPQLEEDLMIVLDQSHDAEFSCGVLLLDPRHSHHAAIIHGTVPFYSSLSFRVPSPLLTE